MKKLWIILPIIAIAAGVGYWKMYGNGETLEGISVVNGRLELDRIDVATLYAGRVETVFVREGDKVEKDQPLAQLSDTQIAAQLSFAEAQKQRATEAMQRSRAEIESYQQQLRIAELEWNNAKKLKRNNLVSDTEVERRQAAYQAAVAAVSAASAANAEAQAAITQAESQIAQAADMRADMLIKSPIAGRVEYKIADAGNVLAAGGKVVSILDLNDVYINVFLPSAQSNRVRIGDEARIVVDGIKAVFPANITYVASEAQFTPKSVETAEERAKLMFKIKLQVPTEVAKQHQSLLKGGMTALGYVKYDPQAQWPAFLAVKLPQTE
ncbi:HlyD family secretion protein [Caviibacterium pharyngocola]|uniref:HlyD family secretion protein n=2 Tax=Caviibacterium pharyngocola TaxID=28159 RepID=A0A2M8RVL5_9PAST|nr:efflux RND transporter periplasmic adaptor subunit [Caviibacterium pharyngocola]PJG82925.1 HlyD family secretion protein [Caviibacterium pharyngocola]